MRSRVLYLEFRVWDFGRVGLKDKVGGFQVRELRVCGSRFGALYRQMPSLLTS